MPVYLLFIIVPAVELFLLLQVGARIGLIATIAAIIATGVIGAALARRQGFHVMRRMQESAAHGRMPTNEIIEGVMILAAGALLLTPGFLTDIVGFLALIPGPRAFFRNLVRAYAAKRVDRQPTEARQPFDIDQD